MCPRRWTRRTRRADRGVSAASRATPAFARSSTELLASYAGRARRRCSSRGAMTEQLGGAADLPQARGPRAHRRAQDQQRARPVPAREAHGQAARDRRDRRRPARRRDRDRVRRCSACAASVYMGAEDVARQALNVFRDGAARRRGRSRSTSGSQTLKDAINEALRDWVTNVATTYYCIGSVMGPHPYPDDRARLPARDRRSRRARRSSRRRAAARRARRVRRRRLERDRALPSVPRRRRACADRRRGGRRGARPAARHGAALAAGVPGVLHGMKTLVLPRRRRADLPGALDLGRARLPGRRSRARPLRDSGRAEYVAATDAEALDAFLYLSRTEGIIPALESRARDRARPAARAELCDALRS